jgi:PAS domain S-box-containing protein
MRERSEPQDELAKDLDRASKEQSQLKAVSFYNEADHSPLKDIADYRDVFRASPGILLLLTPDFLMVDASDARLKATGTRREDIVGQPLFDVFPDNPDNEEAVGRKNLETSLNIVLETKQPHRMALQRYDLVLPDGGFEERYWRPLNAPLLGPDGEVRYILHSVEDATDDVRALQASKRELEVQRGLTWRIIDNAPIGMAFLDQNLIIRYFNQTFARLLGVKVEDVLDHYVSAACSKHDLKEVEEIYLPVVRHGAVHVETEVEYRLKDENGIERTTYWDFKRVPVREPDGRISGAFVTAIDVSDRIRNERLQRERIETLEQVDRYKDQFLGILSHELRTPINGIMGFASVLADGLAGELNAQQHRYLGKILDSSDTLLGLVNDLLDMSRVQAGKFALSLQTVEIAPVIRNALALLVPEAIQKGHSLINLVPTALPSLRADPVRVSQMVSNLVSNAIKFTPEGGTITVKACVDEKVLRVEVTDTGIGVAPEHHADIFQAFTQVDMSSTRTRGGVGLGLPIVKGLAEAHGGQVGVESAGEGKGSTFWFTLPLTLTASQS